MNKFGAGLLTGGILGAAGIAAIMSDKRQRKHVIKGSKKAFKRAGHIVDNVTDLF